MNKIQAAIKCPNCSKVLAIPVGLPCGHSICQEHTNAEKDEIICQECGESHPNKSFVVNKPLMELIAAQIESINFGVVHQAAKSSCDRLEQDLISAETVLNDLSCFIHESVSVLKNKVNLKTEELKLRIDQANQKLVNELDEYEKQCIANLDSMTFMTDAGEFKKLKDATRESLAACINLLNELQYDEKKYKTAKLDCDKSAIDLLNRLESFKRIVFMCQLEIKKKHINGFCQTNIHINYKYVRHN